MHKIASFLTAMVLISSIAGFAFGGVDSSSSNESEKIYPKQRPPETKEQIPRRSRDLRERLYQFEGARFGDAGRFRIGDTYFGGTISLKWPNKLVSIDVRDADLARLTELLSAQTGIQFVLGEGVPVNLKITIRVSKMDVKRFLDTLTATTGLTYIAEHRETEKTEAETAKQEKAVETKSEDSPDSPDFADSEIRKFPFPGKFSEKHPMYDFARKEVTHVTIYSLKSKGVIVNMGKVSASLKNADPIEAVTNLIKQIGGAGYVVMNLDDYLALQDPAQAERIRKALKSAPRMKVNLELRDSPITDALVQLSQRGKFYITIPKPGIPNFLIIPDVEVVDEKILPSLSAADKEAEERARNDQRICMARMKEMVTKLLAFAKANGGVFPDAAEWMEKVPFPKEYQRSYAMNKYLSLRKLSEIKNPSEVVLLFESICGRVYGTEESVIPIRRHPDGIVFGFADGHVEIREDMPNFKP
ncbi:MAG: hypothetical protein K6T99_04220 [Armatimonadetes bacterium]|nr:hypothetical protein [Armatimonadota bacterium]